MASGCAATGTSTGTGTGTSTGTGTGTGTGRGGKTHAKPCTLWMHGLFG
ncbi:hypothetical protein XM95_003082 [Salmonella enterica subsp. enterica]|nr:hypothetical protein [Salmonella enterica subsp. enterica]